MPEIVDNKKDRNDYKISQKKTARKLLFYHMSSPLIKVLTTTTAEKLYHHLEGQDIIGDEQKSCLGFTKGTKDHLLIDKAVLNKRLKVERTIWR